MIFLALTLVIASSLLISSALRIRGKVAHLLALYSLSVANIILTGYILGAIGQLNNQVLFLGFHSGLLLAAYFFWRRSKSPSLWGAFAGTHKILSWQKAKQAIIEHPDLVALSLGIGFFYLFSFILGVTVPPNNYDSLSTHLSRVGYWLQFGSYLPWLTPTLTQATYPLNAPLQTVWTIVFTGGDMFVASVQWFAALVCGISAFGIARFLAQGMRSALFVLLITIGFPLLVLQSSTPQNDIITAAFYSAAVYLALLASVSGSPVMIWMSGLATALGLGTKQTFLMLLPGLAIIFILAMVQHEKFNISQLVRWGVAVLVCAALFGFSYNWMNVYSFREPFGPTEYTNKNLGKTNLKAILGKLVYGLPRLAYQSLDTSGLPRPLEGYAHKIKARLVRPLVDGLNFPLEGTVYTATGHTFNLNTENVNEESNAWYGPLSVVLLLPALFYELVHSLRLKKYVTLGLVISFFLFWPFEIIVRPGWDPYQGRYFAPVFVTAAPLIGIWFQRKGASIFSWGVTILGLIVAGYTLFYNPAKPTLGKWSDDIGVWTKGRIFLLTVQHKVDREMHYMVERNVPEDATLGFIKYGGFTDYPLFGDHFTRRIIPVYPVENVSDVIWLDAQAIEYLLIMDGGSSVPPPKFELLDEVERWRLYHRQVVP